MSLCGTVITCVSSAQAAFSASMQKCALLSKTTTGGFSPVSRPEARTGKVAQAAAAHESLSSASASSRSGMVILTRDSELLRTPVR
ncbi:hypothetical protein RKD44_001460 [Streptomyces collinus]